MSWQSRSLTRQPGITIIRGLSKYELMSWTSLLMRGLLLLMIIALILFLAELTMTLGSLLVFLLAISIGLTWLIINVLRDDNILSDLFDD